MRMDSGAVTLNPADKLTMKGMKKHEGKALEGYGFCFAVGSVVIRAVSPFMALHVLHGGELLSERQAIGKTLRQPGVDDLILSGVNIVFDPAQFD